MMPTKIKQLYALVISHELGHIRDYTKGFDIPRNWLTDGTHTDGHNGHWFYPCIMSTSDRTDLYIGWTDKVTLYNQQLIYLTLCRGHLQMLRNIHWDYTGLENKVKE